MKKWIQKFVSQLHVDSEGSTDPIETEIEVSEERATLLFLIDIYSKYLIDTELSPARRVRETLDEYAKSILNIEDHNLEKKLFQLRQFISSHRFEEYSYVQKSFDEFRKIIWDFVDHLSSDVMAEHAEDLRLSESLENLREAVESNSIDSLKAQSRLFINSYLKIQSSKNQRKDQRLSKIKKNISSMKKQLVDANNSLKLDHLTKAYNRRNFDEQLKQQWNLFQITKHPVTLIMLDIDYFKRINDTFGHAMGDFVLVECVKTLKELFPRDVDAVFRVGGEEFAILLPDYQVDHAVQKAEATLSKVRKETYVEQDMRVNFTLSMGIAQLLENESIEEWMKRADSALYEAKKSGRDRYILAPQTLLKKVS